VAEKTTDFSIIRIKPPTTDKFEAKGDRALFPQTEFAPSPNAFLGYKPFPEP
jgi:hypothetical protein